MKSDEVIAHEREVAKQWENNDGERRDLIMESVLNYMTVSYVLDLIEKVLNVEDYYYYVKDGLIKYEERNNFMERKV